MTKQITSEDINRLSSDFGISGDLIRTVILVECSGNGFDPKTGKIKIQFEPLWFERFSKTKILNGVEGQEKEWEAFEEAYKINTESAIKATSWGMGQVMGFNFAQAGYKDVHTMVSEFKISEYYQVKGMLRFISSNKAMMRALQSKQWSTFAYWYNGPGYKKFNYDVRLADAYFKLKPNAK